MSCGRLPLDSSYRKLIEQRRLRDTARTSTQPSVAWVKINTNWIRGKGREGGRVGGGWAKQKKQITFQARYALQASAVKDSPPPFLKEKKKTLVT